MKQCLVYRAAGVFRAPASITCMVVLLLATVAWAGGIPCWLRCQHPPKNVTAANVTSVLRSKPNPPLDILARSTGILTTYLGKMLGVQGWRNYHVLATVDGPVVQAASSSDGFYTVDIAVRHFVLGSLPVRLGQDSYLRIEIRPWVRHGAPLPVSKNNVICISGALMWDGDGFLEVHPQKATDIAPRACVVDDARPDQIGR